MFDMQSKLRNKCKRANKVNICTVLIKTKNTVISKSKAMVSSKIKHMVLSKIKDNGYLLPER